MRAIEQRRDADIIAELSTADVRRETDAVKAQYADARQQRTVEAAVGKVTDALKTVEARIDDLEARRAKARQDQYIGALTAQLSKPLRAGDFDERSYAKSEAFKRRLNHIFGRNQAHD